MAAAACCRAGAPEAPLAPMPAIRAPGYADAARRIAVSTPPMPVPVLAAPGGGIPARTSRSSLSPILGGSLQLVSPSPPVPGGAPLYMQFSSPQNWQASPTRVRSASPPAPKPVRPVASVAVTPPQPPPPGGAGIRAGDVAAAAVVGAQGAVPLSVALISPRQLRPKFVAPPGCSACPLSAASMPLAAAPPLPVAPRSNAPAAMISRSVPSTIKFVAAAGAACAAPASATSCATSASTLACTPRG